MSVVSRLPARDRRICRGSGGRLMDARVWTIGDALDWTVGYLGRRDVSQPRRSAEWLLSAATGLSRVELYTHKERPLSDAEREAYRAGIERRSLGEPLQYVTGEVAFRHLVLTVRPGVFIPRPETEVLVEAALDRLRILSQEEPEAARPLLVVDLCTGSGAVACSIAHEAPEAAVLATEVSADAAEVARANAERCRVAERVTVLEGDLFGPLPASARGSVAVVVANPPYIPSGRLPMLPAEVAEFEPAAALDGGTDGLDLVHRIIGEAREWLRPGGYLVIEVDESTARDADREMQAWYEGVQAQSDLSGRERLVIGRVPTPDAVKPSNQSEASSP